jgi:hypothetical protein
MGGTGFILNRFLTIGSCRLFGKAQAFSTLMEQKKFSAWILRQFGVNRQDTMRTEREFNDVDPLLAGK